MARSGVRTNKVLMRTGFIYPWSQLINYSYEKQYLIHIKPIKKSAPLHLHIRLFNWFQEGGGIEGQRDRERVDFILYVFKEGRGALAFSLKQILVILALVTNKVLDKFILFKLLISPLC